MTLHLSSLPSLRTRLSLPLPSVSDVSDVVSDVFVTANDTAGEAATVIVASARRRPKVAIGVGVAAAVLFVGFSLFGAAAKRLLSRPSATTTSRGSLPPDSPAIAGHRLAIVTHLGERG